MSRKKLFFFGLFCSILKAIFPVMALTYSQKGDLTVTPQDCAALGVQAIPPADVAYQGGVDTQGNPVVKADIDGESSDWTPQQIIIPLGIPVQSFFGKRFSHLFQKGWMGAITLNLENNQIFFNGHPVENTDFLMDRIKSACQQGGFIP